MSGSSRLDGHPAFRALRRSFAAGLPAKLEALEAAAAGASAPQAGPEQVRSLFQLAHGLAGSAAIYGYLGLSRAAADLEALLWPQGCSQAQQPSDGAALRALVARLRRELARSDAAGGDPWPES